MKKQNFPLLRSRLTTLFIILICLVFTFCSCDSADSGKSYGMMSYNNSDFSGPVEEGKLSLSDQIKTDTALNDGRKLIKNCSITAETKEFDSAVNALNDAVAASGGYISSQRSRGSAYSDTDGSRFLSLTVCIPAEKLDGFISGLSESINVTQLTSSTDDVTEAYVDASARLETLKAERDSLLTMMGTLDNAEQYDFWYKLETRISEIEQDIASIEKSLRNIDQKVAYSTVTIDLHEVKKLSETGEPTFAERIGSAFSESWNNFGEFWKGFAVVFIFLFPALLTIAFISFVTVLIIKSVKKHRRARDPEAGVNMKKNASDGPHDPIQNSGHDQIPDQK